jgi:hypothetical protein
MLYYYYYYLSIWPKKVSALLGALDGRPYLIAEPDNVLYMQVPTA